MVGRVERRVLLNWTGDSNDAGLTEKDGNGQKDANVGRNYGSGREEGVDNREPYRDDGRE
jgi:hypothetical protein